MDAHTRSLIEDARAQLQLAHAAHEAGRPSIQHVRNAERLLGLVLARPAPESSHCSSPASDLTSGELAQHFGQE